MSHGKTCLIPDDIYSWQKLLYTMQQRVEEKATDSRRRPKKDQKLTQKVAINNFWCEIKRHDEASHAVHCGPHKFL